MKTTVMIFRLLTGSFCTTLGQDKGDSFVFNFAVESDSYTYFLKTDVLINQELASNATATIEGGGTTNPCESCLFLHELLDHGYHFIRTGKASNSNHSKKESVQFNNKALRIKGLE